MSKTPPKLSRPAYHVWLAPEGAELDPNATDDDLADIAQYHYVIVNHADQLRAELEGKRHGIVKAQDSPMHLTSLWLWASLVRTGKYDGKFAEFKDACVAYDPDKEPDAADVAPDPTAASTS